MQNFSQQLVVLCWRYGKTLEESNFVFCQTNLLRLETVNVVNKGRLIIVKYWTAKE